VSSNLVFGNFERNLVIDPAKMAVLTSLKVLDFRPVATRETSWSRRFNIVITGFNTDIEHDGVVYHVQTEDKGLDSPLILSLVYSGGAILASKRSRYEDLIAAGFDEAVLTERLKRQHRLICAAINAGRLEELKRMGATAQRESPAVGATDVVAPVTPVAVKHVYQVPPTEANVAATDDDVTVETAGVEAASPTAASAGANEQTPGSDQLPGGESPYTVYDPRRQSPVAEVIAPDMGAALTILDDDEFQAGKSYTIRVLLEDRSGKKEKPLSGVAVTVKILGTTFRPRISSVKTARDGVAAISATTPSFTSGRAAILIQAVVRGQTVELRRVIHPAERQRE
jgi:hypothetical protein